MQGVKKKDEAQKKLKVDDRSANVNPTNYGIISENIYSQKQLKNRYHITRNCQTSSCEENNFEWRNNLTAFQTKQDIDFWKIRKILRKRSRRSRHK